MVGRSYNGVLNNGAHVDSNGYQGRNWFQLSQPEIVLYDEPTTGLDPITGKEIVELILELQRTYGTSSIIISHDLNVAKLAANRIALLHEGRNHVEGTYAQFRESTDPIVQRFFIFM